MGFVSHGLLESCTAFFFVCLFFLRPPSWGCILAYWPPHALLCLVLFQAPTCNSMDLHATATAFYNHRKILKKNKSTAQTSQSLKETSASTFTLSTTPPSSPSLRLSFSGLYRPQVELWATRLNEFGKHALKLMGLQCVHYRCLPTRTLILSICTRDLWVYE